MDHEVSLKVTDYVVVVLVLLVPLGIGVLFAIRDRNRATRDEYLVGGRRMSMLPVTLSIFATYMSAITFMGIPTEIYWYGPMYVTFLIGWGLTFLGVAFFIVPLIYPLRLISLYEYLELRFESRIVRLTAVFLGILQSLGFMSVALLTPALALQAGAGLPMWMSVGIVGLIGTVYTSLGGIKSVMWTDSFQSVIMFTCIYSVIIKGSVVVGGGGTAWDLAEQGGRTSFNAFSPDPRTRHTWWGTIIGGTFFWYGMACNQSGIQRICAMRSAKEAKMAFLYNSVLVIIYGFSLLGVGVVIYAYFHYIRCDPFTAGMIRNRNQLSLYFIMHAFRDTSGMPGLYLAAVFSSALSTISSGINSMAANTVEDLLKLPLSKLTESTATVITKIIVGCYGALIVALAYAANSLEGPVTQLSITANSACGGPLFGLILLGAVCPWINKYGAIGGVSIGLFVNIWISIGNFLYGEKLKVLTPPLSDMCFNASILEFIPNNNMTYTILNPAYNVSNTPPVIQSANRSIFIYNISYEWYGFIGIMVTMIFGFLISYFTRKYSKTTGKLELIIPALRKFWASRDYRYGEGEKCEDEMQSVKMLQLDRKDVYRCDNSNMYNGN